MPRDRVQLDSPGSEAEADDTVSATFGAAFAAFLKPLKEDVDSNESTAIASFLREAHNLNSQRAIMEAFIGPVIAHLGKNLLSDLWDGDVDDMTVDEVKSMNVSLLRRFLRAKNSAVYAADARRRAATNVKMAAVLADAIGGSFVVDLYQRHGVPIATPLLDSLECLVPKGHFRQDNFRRAFLRSGNRYLPDDKAAHTAFRLEELLATLLARSGKVKAWVEQASQELLTWREEHAAELRNSLISEQR